RSDVRVPLALRSRPRARSGSRHGLRYGLAVAATVIVILILGVIAIAAVVRHPDGQVSASQSTRGPGAKPTPTDPLVSMEFKCSASIGLGISVQWAVGLASAACFRAMFYSSPVRLVVDFRAE